MIYDCHLHTEFSGDSSTPVRSQLDRAIELGMEELCITDHHDFDSDFCEDNFVLDTDSYLPALESIRREYQGKLRVNIGIELGLQSHLKEYLTSFIETYGEKLDFVIGSSHFIDGQDPYYPAYWQKTNAEDGLRRFFQVSLKRVQTLSHVFDSYGHLDYALRYIPGENRSYRYEDYSQWIDPILETLISRGKALECNTGGFKYGLGEPNPSVEVLLRYRQLGGTLLTIGSDAHTPQVLAYDFERCRRLLLDCGFSHYTVYRGRKPFMIPL